MAKIEVTRLDGSGLVFSSFSLRFINQRNREGNPRETQKLECNHILPIVFRLLGYSLSTKKKLKVSAFEDFSLSVPCTAAVDTLYHIYYYLSHFVQQQNEKCSAGKWRYQCRVSL